MKDLLNVFKSEIFKVTKKRSFLMATIFIAVIPVACVVFTILSFTTNVPAFNGFSTFGVVDSMYIWFPMVAGVYLAACFGDDYTNEGIKQIVSSGIKRNTFIVGQWLAHVVLLSAVTLGLGAIFCLVNTVLVGFGDHSVVELLVTAFEEILTIAVLTSLTQTVMHISKSTGTSIVVIVLLFLVIPNTFQLLAYVSPEVAEFIYNIYLVTFLKNTCNLDLALMERICAFAGVLVYQGIFLCTSVKIFEKEQI